jgi:integrase
MSATVRQRGSKFELRVRHRNLPKPYYFTFDVEDEARSYGDRLQSLLDQGFVPPELLAPSKGDDNPLAGDIICAYLEAAPGLTDSDRALLTTMMPQVIVRLSALNYQWAEHWVATLKARQLAPGTIRKYVGALARVMDWHFRTIQSDRQNPLRMLPRGYSSYDSRDAVQVVDAHRDRRLLPGESDAILEALPEDMAQLFQVLCWTGLRLREAYKLRVDQIDMQKWVIKVDGSKGARGASKPRTVPIVPELRPVLADMVKGRVGRLWGFWDGDPATLDNATARLSASFTYYFDKAGITNLVAHDLRHEACCRWVERRDGQGRWVFSEIEVARIMGWSSLRMMMRYASIRGEDLAARLG